MGFREVTALRKEGRLDEALAMARDDYEYSVDKYSASALFWTLRLVCERAVQADDTPLATDLLDEMKSVFENLDDSEGMAERMLSKLEAQVTPHFMTVVNAQEQAKSGNPAAALAAILPIDTTGFPENIRENAGWTVFYYLRSNKDTISLSQMKEAVDKYFTLDLKRPSKLHSMVLFYAVNFASKDDCSHSERLVWFRQFFEQWGMGEGLMEEDWKQNVYEGKHFPSLAEKAIRCYSEAPDSGSSDVESYKALLEKASSKVSENENILRKLAMLYHKTGRKDDAIRITKDLIKTHTGKFYFWYELAHYVGSEQLDLCIACCAKALLSTREERYLGNIHIAMGSLLAKKGLYAEVLCEAEKYKAICVENRWTVRAQYNALRSMVPSGTVRTEDNHGLYKQYESIADEFMYSDIPSRTMVLTESFFQENKHSGKKRLIFVLYDKNNKSIWINPNAFGLDRKTKFGTCFEVKSIVEDNRERALTVRQVEKVDVLSYKSAVIDNVNPSKKVVHAVGVGFDIIIPMDRIFRSVKVGDSIDVAFYTVKKDMAYVKRVINVRRSEIHH